MLHGMLCSGAVVLWLLRLDQPKHPPTLINNRLSTALSAAHEPVKSLRSPVATPVPCLNRPLHSAVFLPQSSTPSHRYRCHIVTLTVMLVALHRNWGFVQQCVHLIVSACTGSYVVSVRRRELDLRSQRIYVENRPRSIRGACRVTTSRHLSISEAQSKASITRITAPARQPVSSSHSHQIHHRRRLFPRLRRPQRPSVTRRRVKKPLGRCYAPPVAGLQPSHLFFRFYPPSVTLISRAM